MSFESTPGALLVDYPKLSAAQAPFLALHFQPLWGFALHNTSGPRTAPFCGVNCAKGKVPAEEQSDGVRLVPPREPPA